MGIKDYILYHSAGNLYWKDKNLRYLGCNEGFLKISKLKSQKEIFNRTDEEMFLEKLGRENIKKLFDVDSRVIQEGIEIVCEETGINEQGEQAIYLTKKCPLRDNKNKIIGLIGTSIDISEIKNTERKLRKSQKKAELAGCAKTEFLSNMRHDLRTPFCGILGLSEIIARDEENPEKKELLRYIAQSSKELLNQLNEILDFIGSEEGKIPILNKQFDLHQLIRSIVAMMIPATKAKELEFKCFIDENVSQFVIGDRVRTQRILINLLSNAVKFTKEGYVELHVSIAKRDDKKMILNFSVKDTGIGIPEEKYNLIFEQFNRLTSSYSGVYPGKGLGLRMVKHLLDEIGGEPHVTSNMGQGSIFTILIPYKRSLLDHSLEQLVSKAY